MNQAHKSSRQCPVLRRHLFLTLRECVHEIRAATIQLVREHPLCEDVDTNLMCAISLSNYGNCMTDTSEEDLLMSTDEFSLTAIKAMAELCFVHLSEFLHRVALCYVPEVQRSTSGSTHVTTLSLSALLLPLETVIASRHSLIHRQYHYHWSGFTEEAVERNSHVTNHVITTSHLQVAMHAVNLQLRDVFKRGLDTESLVNKDVTIELIEQQLTMLRAKLNSCLCSVDSVQLSMTSQQESVAEDSVPAALPPVEPQVKVQVVKEPKSLIGMGEPVIEDQVFEGHTEDNEDICYDDDDWLSPIDKAKRKRDKLEALKLLSELKSVIAVRAVDMELREKRALERQTGMSHTGGQASGTDSGSVRLEQMSGSYEGDRVSTDCTDGTCSISDVERLDATNQGQTQLLSIKCEIDVNDKLVSSPESCVIGANVTVSLGQRVADVDHTSSTCDAIIESGDHQEVCDPHGSLGVTGWSGRNDHSPVEGDCECEGHDTADFNRSRGGARPLVTSNMAFASNIAAMVALRSREMNLNCEETFGDDDDSDSSDVQEITDDDNVHSDDE